MHSIATSLPTITALSARGDMPGGNVNNNNRANNNANSWRAIA
jgi:hypothetical protein